MTEPRCRGAETEVFYDPRRWGIAQSYCRECPIIAQCRLDFVEDHWAFAGGMTPGQRQAWSHYRDRPKPKPVAADDGSRPSRHLSDADRAEIVRIFDTERPVGTLAIARRMGISKSAVQRVLRNAGRSLTADEIRTLTRRGGLPSPTRPLVESLLSQGRKPREIQEVTGMTLSHIYTIRREMSNS